MTIFTLLSLLAVDPLPDGHAMATATKPNDYARDAAKAYEDELRQQFKQYGSTPPLDPETAGRRAALATASSLAWNDDIGPFYDTDGARAALGGVTKQAVSGRVSGRRLLGLRLASNGSGRDRMVYPVWQFRSAVLRELPRVLPAAGYDPQRPTTGWTIAAWLRTTDPRLEGLTPTDFLERGHVAPVLAAARDVAVSLGVDELEAARSAASAAG